MSQVPQYRERVESESETESEYSSRDSSLEIVDRRGQRSPGRGEGQRSPDNRTQLQNITRPLTSETNSNKQQRIGSSELASEYLRQTLGDSLTKILTDVATKRPDDPIAYIADQLSRVASGKRETVENLGKRETVENFGKREAVENLENTRKQSDSAKSGRKQKKKKNSVEKKLVQSRIPTRTDISSSSTLSSVEGISTSSAPASSKTDWSSNSYGDKRSLSLNALRDSEVEGGGGGVERRRRKKKTPTVAMTAEDYKKKRGIIQIRKTEDDTLVDTSKRKRNPKPPSQPSILTEDFDLKKHFEKSRRMRQKRDAKDR